MLAPPRARRSEARRGGDQQEAVDTDSNARFDGEVEWNESGQNYFGVQCRLERLNFISQFEQLTLNQRVAGSSPAAPTK